MRRAFAVLLCAGCANGGLLIGDDAAAPQDDAAQNDVLVLPLDGAPKDVAIDTFDAGCARDAAFGGIGLPAGTTASATTTYASNVASLAIDGDEGTYWNAGGFAGSITVTFPSPTTFDGVHLYVSALPTTSESYTIYGIQGTTANVIAQSTQTAQQSGGALADIAVPSQPYDGIRIDVNGNASWVAINEIAFTNSYCP